MWISLNMTRTAWMRWVSLLKVLWVYVVIRFYIKVVNQFQELPSPQAIPKHSDGKFWPGMDLIRVGYLTQRSTNSWCKLNSVIYDCFIFFIDKSMFFLCKYSMRKWMVEVLNMVKRCKMYYPYLEGGAGGSEARMTKLTAANKKSLTHDAQTYI